MHSFSLILAQMGGAANGIPYLWPNENGTLRVHATERRKLGDSWIRWENHQDE